MHIELIITGVFIVGICAVMSVILLSGHGGFLISGYNCLSTEEKQKYDEKKLCRATGVMLSVITAATAGLFICLTLDVYILPCTVIYTIIILISVAIGIYYENSKCLKINYDSDVVIGLRDVPSSPEYKKQKRKRINFLIGSIAFSIIFVAVIFIITIHSARPTEYITENGALQISMAFGESISFSEIEKVQLINNMPDNLSKTYGLDLGTILKGEFKSNDEKLHVYVDTSKPPFIYIYTKNGLTIVNTQTKTETQALFKNLLTQIPHSAQFSETDVN
jgi:hypothetical protein